LGSPDQAAVDRALGAFRAFAGVLEHHLRDRTWLVGDALTVADFSVAVVLPYAAQAPIPLDEFPAIRRWHERLNAFEAWRDPFPAGQAVHTV
jgi:glutathione S-transferase